jgi:hypothetical protein
MPNLCAYCNAKAERLGTALAAFASFVQLQACALLVQADPAFTGLRGAIA